MGPKSAHGGLILATTTPNVNDPAAANGEVVGCNVHTKKDNSYDILSPLP